MGCSCLKLWAADMVLSAKPTVILGADSETPACNIALSLAFLNAGDRQEAAVKDAGLLNDFNIDVSE